MGKTVGKTAKTATPAVQKVAGETAGGAGEALGGAAKSTTGAAPTGLLGGLPTKGLSLG